MNKELLKELRGLRKEVVSRLDRLEEMAQGTAEDTAKQQEQIDRNANEIEKIYEILSRLVKEQGRACAAGTVVPKEPFYTEVEAEHIPRREAMRLLKERGSIRGSGNKSTFVYRLEGRPARVMLVIKGDADGNGI